MSITAFKSSVLLFTGAAEGTINPHPKTTQQEETTQTKLITTGQSFFSAIIVLICELNPNLHTTYVQHC